jgi:hypothetical protein
VNGKTQTLSLPGVHSHHANVAKGTKFRFAVLSREISAILVAVAAGEEAVPLISLYGAIVQSDRAS